MFLRKIVSTFVCLGLSLVCCGIYTLHASNLIRGAINNNSCDISYELKLSRHIVGKPYHIECSIQDNRVRGESIICKMDYTVNDEKWKNKKYVESLLNKLAENISNNSAALSALIFNNVFTEREAMIDSSEPAGNQLQCDKMSNIVINSKEQLTDLRNAEKKLDNNVTFENFTWDDECMMCFYAIRPKIFEFIGFKNCILDDEIQFSEILDSCSIKNLSIINSGLTDDDLIWMMKKIGNTKIHNLDLSNNKLTRGMIDELRTLIYRLGFSIKSMDLSGNNDITNEIAKKVGGFVNDQCK